MKRKLFIFIYCSLMALLTSCSNYLDVQPKGKIIPKTAEDFSTIIHYWLDQVEKGTDDVIISSSTEKVKLENFAEDLNATLASSYSYSAIYSGDAINNNQSYYKTLYSIIKDCNMIIGNMEDTETELARTLLGTAWSIRSICYYNLMLRYCEPYRPKTASETLGLPLVDEFDMEAKPARANLKETAEFIEKGFQKAISYNVVNEDFLFTSPVAKAYLARLLFWTQDWSNAITYAKEVLEKYPMLEANEFVEAINQKQKKTHNVIIRSFTEDDDIGSMSYSTAQTDIKKRPVDKNLIELFALTPNDVRKTYDSKRLVTKIITSKFRSEELCLIIAESYAHLSKETEALDYLNQLRAKRITKDYTAYTMDNLPEVFPQLITTDATDVPLSKLISAILCERRKEMFLEGDRWFELKRNGCPEFWVAAKGKKFVTEKYLYTYPIPRSDVNLFPGLIIQNPGYKE
ncbi:RagB/SusD family nutrient uptake outer membrane protein [Bacteroides bouchesdurhonensis]